MPTPAAPIAPIAPTAPTTATTATAAATARLEKADKRVVVKRDEKGDEKRAEEKGVEEKKAIDVAPKATVWMYPDTCGQNVQVQVDEGEPMNLPHSVTVDGDKVHTFRFVFVDDRNAKPIEHAYEISGNGSWTLTPTKPPTPR